VNAVCEVRVPRFTGSPGVLIFSWRGLSWRGQTEFQVNLKLGLTPEVLRRS